MARKGVRIKNIDKVIALLRETFRSASESKKMLDNIGDFVVTRNKFFARTGKSLSNNKAPIKLPELQDTSKAQRARIAKKFPEFISGKFFKAERSNVTLSGQLLNSLNFKIKKKSVVLFFKGKRKVISPNDLKSNDAVYDNLVDLGFDFLGLDEKGQKRVSKLVLDEFRRTIKKNF